MSTAVAPYEHAPAKAYRFERTRGPVPGTWTITLSCPHGSTTAYLADRRLRDTDEGAAILGIVAERHQRRHPRCRCLGRAGDR